MTTALTRARRAAGTARRWIAPRPEVRAWRHACRTAERVPRCTPGRIRLMGYDVGYADLLTLCPQWEDIFVRQALAFHAAGPEPRILDCGAHVGLATLYWKRRYPRARITAYEADPAIHALLSDNLRRNRHADVEALHAAVWVEEGVVDFRCEGADSGTIAHLADGQPGHTRRVPAIRLRDALRREPVDLLKLDIEGAEAATLADCAESLGGVAAVAVEVHDFEPDRRILPAVLETLTGAGFRYALDRLVTLPGRAPSGGPASPFPAAPPAWVVLVRGWRP
jgi:FkbM family methyltransferase